MSLFCCIFRLSQFHQGDVDRVPCYNTASWRSIRVMATFILFLKTLPSNKGPLWSLEIIFLERKSTNDPNKYFVKERLVTEKKFDRFINMSPQQNPYWKGIIDLPVALTLSVPLSCYTNTLQLSFHPKLTWLILNNSILSVKYKTLITPNKTLTVTVTFTSYDFSACSNSRWKLFTDAYCLFTTALIIYRFTLFCTWRSAYWQVSCYLIAIWIK